MKRLLLSLLSLTLGPLTTHAMMLRVDPKKEVPKSYSAAQIEKFLRKTNTKEQNLELFQSGANILCAQDELAQAVKAVQIYPQDYDATRETDLIEEIVQSSGSNKVTSIDELKKTQYTKLLLQEMPDISPEAIAFTLNVNNALFNSKECRLDWESISEAAQSENFYLKTYAMHFLDQKDRLETKRRSMEDRNHLESFTEKIIHNLSSPEDIKDHIQPLKLFVNGYGHLRVQLRTYFESLAKQNPELTPEEFRAIVNTENNIADKAALITGKILAGYTKVQFEFAKKKNAIDDEFIKAYMPIRISCCETYKSLRTLLNKYTQNDPNLAETYLSKIYNPSFQFPRELPSSIEPRPLPAPSIVAKPIVPTTEEIKEPAPAAARKVKKNKAKKQINVQIDSVASASASSSLVATSASTQPAPAAFAKTKIAKKIAQSFIKEIPDLLNTMSIHLYCSFKQKKEVPTFARHKRLHDWFDDGKGTLFKQGYMDPESPKHVYKDTAIAYHSFSLDVDPIAQKYGTQYEEVDKNGIRTLFIAIPGHIVRNGQITFGIFGYAINPIEKLCYHRCFEERTSEQLLNEYLNAQEWKVTLDQIAQA